MARYVGELGFSRCVYRNSEEGEVMTIAHKKHPVFRVQFHPESVMTEHGHDLLRNFLSIKYANPLF